MSRCNTRGWWAVGLWMCVILSQCSEPIPVPKPRGFFRIDMPDRIWSLRESACGLSFELPQYAREFQPHSSEFSEGVCGFNLVFPNFHAMVHCTYVPLRQDRSQLDKLVQDAHELAFNHDIKATGIGRQQFAFSESSVYGLFYDLSGPVATPIQFYATDSLHHFVRGSLYFNHTPQPDSLAPSLAHIRTDLVHMIETLQW